MEVFENEGSASLCGRAKTEVQRLCVDGRKRRFSETITSLASAMSELKKQNGCFLIRFRWSSVDGRKRYKNASVDEKHFYPFSRNRKRSFRKRISVDRVPLEFCFVFP